MVSILAMQTLAVDMWEEHGGRLSCFSETSLVGAIE
jgi:hypothetical protein